MTWPLKWKRARDLNGSDAKPSFPGRGRRGCGDALGPHPQAKKQNAVSKKDLSPLLQLKSRISIANSLELGTEIAGCIVTAITLTADGRAGGGVGCSESTRCFREGSSRK